MVSCSTLLLRGPSVNTMAGFRIRKCWSARVGPTLSTSKPADPVCARYQPGHSERHGPPACSMSRVRAKRQKSPSISRRFSRVASLVDAFCGGPAAHQNFKTASSWTRTSVELPDLPRGSPLVCVARWRSKALMKWVLAVSWKWARGM